MKETRMPPAQAANLVANSGNTLYGVSVIIHGHRGGLADESPGPKPLVTH